jgi:hypothetical protein
MDPEEFLHGVALGQILGPAAVNTAFFLGHRRFGMLGALACAGAFLAPSVALVILLSWLYFSFHALPSVTRNPENLSREGPGGASPLPRSHCERGAFTPLPSRRFVRIA